MKPGGFLTIPEHTGLILCADGVQLFKSSKQSFWPILLSVTSLPPGIRMNAENIILAGVWQGSVKPPMNTILSPILEKINQLHIHGIPVNTPSGLKIVRACLLLAVFDLPAKALAMNFVQFNGYYSCTYCLDEGKHISHTHIFPPEAEHEPRTMTSILDCAKEAEQSARPVLGVKGSSVLASSIDFVKAIPVDYMHAILEGISRKLLSTYLDSKNHSYRFYLGGSIEEIDRRMLKIKPPQEFRRSPRSVKMMKQWKASEYRAWLLYYSLPVLSNLLPSDYIYHLALLVSAMHILLGDAIQSSDIDIAHELLVSFYELVPKLYPISISTANMHSIIHLAQFVRDWGPLWCYSCFGFESVNGHLRKYCHGTRYILPQMINNVRLNQILPIKSRRLISSCNPSTAAFIQSMTGVANRISSDTEIKSCIRQKKLDEKLTEALYSASFIDSLHPLPNLPICEKVRHKSVLYVAKKGSTSRDGSVCVFHHGSTLLFGSIIQFCFTAKGLVTLIEVFEQVNKGILGNIHPTNLKLNHSNKVNDFIFCVKNNKHVLATSVNSIFAKCVHVPDATCTYYDYVITMPNMFEHH